MNLPQEMYTDIKEMLPQLQEALQTGTAYATDLGHRIIQYDIWNNIFCIVVFGILPTLIAFYLIKLRKKINDIEFDFLYIISGCLFVISIAVILISTKMIIQGVFIPEIRIIEILSNLIK